MDRKFDRLGFFINRKGITNNILIPKYYNPEIRYALDKISETYTLHKFADLVDEGYISVSSGHAIDRINYGTGNIPYVRTSDISNWEIKTDPKHGVSREVFEKFRQRQDVQPNDILFVQDGTYLVGNACIVLPENGELLYQQHLLKFRINEGSPISAPLLLASLSTPIVRAQIRSKQFTADILDLIGQRYREVILPVPKDEYESGHLSDLVLASIRTRISLREKLRKLPFVMQGLIPDLDYDLEHSQINGDSTRESSTFYLSRKNIVSNILIPKYYDPKSDESIDYMREEYDTYLISELEHNGIIELSTGVEVGSENYGSGNIPFLRTSDIANWEISSDPKQGISETVYEKFKSKGSVTTGDILIVRDGTYLIGTSCIVTEYDHDMIVCAGIIRIRIKKPEVLDPYLLLTALNMPITKEQIRNKQFTRDIIDTLGSRLREVTICIPKDPLKREKIASESRDSINSRVRVRNSNKQISSYTSGSELLDANEENI